MSPIDRLTGLAGPWQATYQLRGDPSFAGDSPSSAVITPTVGGRFARIDYAWSDRGKPQEGALVVGFEPGPGRVSVMWLDTWHNSNRMMICSGTATPDGGIDVVGTYPTGEGSPDWGWRTRLDVAADTWTMTMFNVSPEGQEDLAVRAVYRRA
jgi:hypothetical protein